MPWPALELVRSRIGRPDAVAAWRRAVILRELAGSTRPSWSPVRKRTAGYFVPSTTWWYGEYA